jgi:hypothetical protein
MANRTTSAVGQRRVYRTALGYLLLFLITYGVTVEAAQSHGLVPNDRPNVAAISDGGTSQSSSKGRSHQTECPMCQFQQQLFNGVVHAPPLLVTPAIQIAFFPTLTNILSATSSIPNSGRAPPLS